MDLTYSTTIFYNMYLFPFHLQAAESPTAISADFPLSPRGATASDSISLQVAMVLVKEKAGKYQTVRVRNHNVSFCLFHYVRVGSHIMCFVYFITLG